MEELQFLREIKSVAFTTVEDGLPHARIVDIMLIENDTIYFITARGKSFYRQIESTKYVAIVGMDTNYKTIRVSGNVRKVERDYVDKIFDANPSMNEIYPGQMRDILEAFCIYEGVGETFDLSATPPKRHRFAFGGCKVIAPGYKILDNCTQCNECIDSCPENSISDDLVIDTQTCIDCGRCYEVCPADAIARAHKFVAR